jgi:hypothetical protein
MALNPLLQQTPTFDPTGVQPPSGPVFDLIPVTPSDSVDIDSRTRCVYIATGGVFEFLTWGGTVRNVTLAAGWHPLIPRRIRSTNTTASGIAIGV